AGGRRRARHGLRLRALHLQGADDRPRAGRTLPAGARSLAEPPGRGARRKRWDGRGAVALRPTSEALVHDCAGPVGRPAPRRRVRERTRFRGAEADLGATRLPPFKVCGETPISGASKATPHPPQPLLIVLLRPSLLLLALLAAATLRAQPVVDGVTVGIGVSTYQGDLDLNPNDGPVEFLALGSPFVHVAADRTFGPVITEASLQLDRYAIESELIDMHLTAASLNLTGGLRFEVTEQVPIQVFAGVAPMLVMPTYDRLDDSVTAGNAYAFEEQGGHLAWPVRGGPSVLTNASNPDVERGGVSGYGVVGARLWLTDLFQLQGSAGYDDRLSLEVELLFRPFSGDLRLEPYVFAGVGGQFEGEDR